MTQIQLLHESEKWVKRVADMVYKEFVAASGSGLLRSLMANARERFRHLNTTAKNGPSTNPGWHRFFVEPACRSLGIGQTLIEALQSSLKHLGYTEVYLKTEHASDYYKKRGWIFVESLPHVDIFKYMLV